MHIEKLISTLKNTAFIIECETEFFRLIHNLSSTYIDITKASAGLLNISHPNTLWETAQSQKSALTSAVKKHLRQEKFSTITKSAQKLEDALHLTEISTNRAIASYLSSFIDAVDSQLDAPSTESAFQLAYTANEITKTLSEAKLYTDMLLETIAKDLYEVDAEHPSIKIFFPESVSLELFSSKTTALNLLIEECCNLIGLSSLEADVKINKIESGSYFAKISANPVVIMILTAVITNGSTYLFKELDETNKIAPLKESSEVIEKLLKIRDTLTLNGHNVELLDENIKKSSIILSKQLEKLLDHSYQIEINDNIIQAKNRHTLQHQPAKQISNQSDQLNIAKSD